MDERSAIVDLSDAQSPSKRGPKEDLDVLPESRKRVKMKDLDSVLGCVGMRKCSRSAEVNIQSHRSKEDETSQVTDMASSLHSDDPVQLLSSNNSVEPTSDIFLSLGLLDTIQSSQNLISNGAHTMLDKMPDSHNRSSTGLSLDHIDDPFHPYKKLGQVRSTDATECGSTAGPVEKRDPMRVWKEMKQNGFLSSSHGGIPVPKQRRRQPKRSKDVELKRKSDITKRELPPNKYIKVAAPTGLLSGLNPGIIKHVRNSDQVNSILEAMLQSEKTDSQIQNRHIDQLGTASKDVTTHNSTGSQFSSSLLSGLEHGGQMFRSDIAGRFFNESSTVPRFNHEYDDQSLTLKSSSSVATVSEDASSTSNDEFSADHDAIASLSLKGASVAFQWLELLQQDIKGRLAALRRSKKRVRNVIHTELPYLLSKEMLLNQEQEGMHSSLDGFSKKAILDMHMARWKSIFGQMDKALHDEGKYLENWWKQVRDMQTHCEAGLKYFGTNHTVLLAEELSGQKKKEAVDRENAVRAAAASIYSTSNFIMTKENVPCF